jgi:hypothetical protein
VLHHCVCTWSSAATALLQAHKAYLETTEHRTSAFKQLTRNDAQAARVIEKRMRKLGKLQQALAHWRTKIATNGREWEERNRALRNEKEIMSRHYAHLKGGMDSFRAAQVGPGGGCVCVGSGARAVLDQMIRYTNWGRTYNL